MSNDTLENTSSYQYCTGNKNEFFGENAFILSLISTGSPSGNNSITELNILLESFSKRPYKLEYTENRIFNSIGWKGFSFVKPLKVRITHQEEAIVIENDDLHISILSENLEDGLVEFFEHLVEEYEMLNSLSPDERSGGMEEIFSQYRKILRKDENAV